MILVFIRSRFIANCRKLSEYGITEEIENVSHLAPIHDIGKIRVPIEILNKNGKLTTIDEMEVVKQHQLPVQR